MREVLAARSDRDFVRTAPRRRSHPPEMSGGRRLLAAGLKSPGLLVGGIAIATAATAIIMNALSFQSSRHPAPIFAKAERGSAPQADVAARPLAPTPPARPPTAHLTAPLPPARDLIAEIIRGSDITGSAPVPGRMEEAQGEPQRFVASAQRALVKLGYGPLKADGIYGQGTRQAIERFERDHRLPATGELGARTVRELSAQSGIRVE